MLNPNKVKAMSRSALFENNEGRETLKLKEYCDDIPLWKGFGRSAIAGVILYFLLLIVFLLAFTDWFVALTEELGNLWTALLGAASLAVFAVAYSIISDLVFRYRYQSRRSSLCRYQSDRHQLELLEQDQEMN